VINETVDWSRELGGGTRIALIQAGWFTTDAGAAFGPVPRIMWQRLVEAELSPTNMLNQALNCLLVEAPAGRVLIETGIGERMDEHHRAQRGVTGKPILPSLRDAGFDPDSIDVVAVSHLHFDHAGGLLTSDAQRAFPRARVVAQADEWRFALDENPRLQASYEQEDLRLVEPWAAQQAADGDEEVLPGVSVVRTGGHSGGHQAVVVRGPNETVGFFGDLCMRPWSAHPRWVPAFDDFPLTSVEVKASLFRQAAEEGWTVVLSHELRQPVGRFVADRDRFKFEPTI
jgi:glyoxylase-like metal-dependent hydrolase (beta-lactamase superfamily II)